MQRSLTARIKLLSSSTSDSPVNANWQVANRNYRLALSAAAALMRCRCPAASVRSLSGRAAKRVATVCAWSAPVVPASRRAMPRLARRHISAARVPVRFGVSTARNQIHTASGSSPSCKMQDWILMQFLSSQLSSQCLTDE